VLRNEPATRAKVINGVPREQASHHRGFLPRRRTTVESGSSRANEGKQATLKVEFSNLSTAQFDSPSLARHGHDRPDLRGMAKSSELTENFGRLPSTDSWFRFRASSTVGSSHLVAARSVSQSTCCPAPAGPARTRTCPAIAGRSTAAQPDPRR